LVGNIVQERPYSEGGQELRHGTKHFAPGTKVYCLPAQWGDGYEKIIAIGRHRGSKDWVTMVVESSWVTNWRAKVVYELAVLRRIQMATKEAWQRNWTSQQEVEACVADLTQPTTRIRVPPLPAESKSDQQSGCRDTAATSE
jgi:hypothetical protein